MDIYFIRWFMIHHCIMYMLVLTVPALRMDTLPARHL